MHHAYVTLAGGFAGALAHNIGKFFLVKNPKPPLDDDKFTNDYADLRFGLEFHKCMIAFGGFCVLFCLVMELLIDFESELTPGTKGAWPPSLAGFGIGLINFFSLSIAGDSMGSSTGYAQIVFQESLLNKDFYKKEGKDGAVDMPQYAGDQSGGGSSNGVDRLNSFIAKYWQIPYLAASIVGAWLSKEVAGNTAAQGIPDAKIAFLGGFLMLFGSRFGGGCTSGHGIAGMPLLFVNSILAVCAMFGVGILCAVLMDASGELALTGKR